MEQFKNLIKQRRIWAGLFATIALLLPVFGYNGEFNPDVATDVIMALVEAVSGVLAVILPIWSYYKPKQ